MIEAGKLLQNRYRVQQQIGQGGMGAVYLATDERFGSVVAIKETLVMENQYLKAIEREARLLNSLRHPALPRVSDHFTEENGQFLVMEYIAGDDLSEMMEKSGEAFPVEDVLDWADQLLDALEFLHTQELPVIHRDIKPQNLKLTPRGQIVLLDFGLAKGNPTDAAHQTASKSIFGYSRTYASLEQIQGTGTDPRSDLYSLAATLYHLLVGAAPEDALTRAMHVLSEKDDTLEPANSIKSQIPQGVAAVLHNAMALNANHRPPSAKAMRRMLRDYEKYANLITESAVRKSKSNAEAAQDAAGRVTKLMPIAENNQTDVKTRILSDEDSQATVIKNPSPKTETQRLPATLFATRSKTNSNKPKKRSALAAVALGGVLAAGVAGSALYFFQQPDTEANSDTNPSASKLKAVTAENITNDVANSNVAANVAANVDTAAALPIPETPKQMAKNAATGTGKNNETAKNSGKNVKKSGTAPAENEDSVKIDGETVYFGDMKVTDERIETPTMIIDENGMRLKNSAKPPTPEEIKQMENRIKRRVIRNMMKTRPQPSPPKPPTAISEDKP